MTASDETVHAASQQFKENLARIEALTLRLTEALSQKRAVNPALEGPGADLYLKASTSLMREMMEKPSKIVEAQVAYWGQAMTQYMEATEALRGGTLTPPADTGRKDRRFSNPLWDTHPYFNFVKQQYLIASDAVKDNLSKIEGLDDVDQKRMTYFAQQIVDLMAPTNFLATNPDALERAVETEGESLVRGLENLVRDVEANKGDLVVTLADRDAFKLGENIATMEALSSIAIACSS